MKGKEIDYQSRINSQGEFRPEKARCFREVPLLFVKIPRSELDCPSKGLAKVVRLKGG